MSLLGTDFSAEGPFVKGKQASYLFNYRYSTLGYIGPIMNVPNLPTYQDFSFKLDFPTQNAGMFSFWGLGADDINIKTAETDISNWETDYDRNL